MIAPGPPQRPVIVAGVGQTGPVTEDPRSIPEMVLEAVEGAVADARLDLAAVDAVVTASVDLFDGLTASNIAITEVVGAVMKPETRIAADGLAAAIHACCQLRAGAYDTVLVVAHGKPSMSSHEALTRWAMDPIHLQPLGVDFLVCAGLQARAVAGGDATAEQRWAGIAARRRAAAAADGVTGACEVEEILASPNVASPLRAEMCAPLADSACAVVLTTRGADSPAGRRVCVTGAGHDLAPHAPGDRDLAAWEGLHRACRRAVTTAGIEPPPPPSFVDLLEPSCRYPHEEELFLAAFPGTDALVSPGGGLFAGATPVTAGLSRLVAATRWLRDTEGGRRALAHGTWGPAGQAHAVTLLESTP